MRPYLAALTGALAAAGAFAVASLASGGGPPESDAGPPAVHTVVAHGTAEAKVIRPDRLNNRTIGRAARQAREAAVPKAVKAARRDAVVLARAARLRLSGPIGIDRDVSPFGYYGFPPHEQAVRVTVTFATG